MERIAMVPLLSFEVLVNVSVLTSSIPITHSNDKLQVYLTSLFLIPLRRVYLRYLLYATNANHIIALELYSYRHNTNTTLRTVALRTFIGSCATLTSSVTNITVLMVLNGEPGWVCMMCCNSDSKASF